MIDKFPKEEIGPVRTGFEPWFKVRLQPEPDPRFRFGFGHKVPEPKPNRTVATLVVSGFVSGR